MVKVNLNIKTIDVVSRRKVWLVKLGTINYKHLGGCTLLSIWDNLEDALRALSDYTDDMLQVDHVDDGLSSETEHYTAWDNYNYVGVSAVYMNTPNLFVLKSNE